MYFSMHYMPALEKCIPGLPLEDAVFQRLRGKIMPRKAGPLGRVIAVIDLAGPL